MKATEAKLLQILGAVSQFILPIDQRTYSWMLKQCQQFRADIRRAAAANYGLCSATGYKTSRPSTCKKSVHINVRLLQDGPERALGHVASVIRDGRVAIAGGAIPDFMGPCRLSIKDESEPTQLLGDLAVTKA
jgi:hypothetical protein